METLPRDVILYLLSFVDGFTLIRAVALVSKHYRTLVEDERLWKQICFIGGYPENHRPPNHHQPYQFLWRSKNINGQGNNVGYYWNHTYAYTGKLKNCLRHGFGVCVMEGVTCIGMWENGHLKNGVVHWTNGDYYKGELVEWRKTGPGVFVWADGSRYVGNYYYDARSGYGIQTYDNGDRYEGTWVYDRREGQGTYTWSDGRSYVGQWKDGGRSGFGTLQFPDGSSYEGNWKANYRHGRGRQQLADGSYYDGEWETDIPREACVQANVWDKFFLLSVDEQRKLIKRTFLNN